MTSKFELSLSPDYVKDWTVQDALRELIQNALDQETVIPDNKASINWDGLSTLTISNKSSVLKRSSLLLGATTKSDDSNTIGCFGEGYKIAMLVLLRNGHDVTILNYGAKEIWKPRFVKSRRYGTDVLTVFVESMAIWNKAPDDNLSIIVDGVDSKVYDELKQRTLVLQDDYDYVTTDIGRILISPQHRGKVFVNGLYITTVDTLEYGYDFKPSEIKIGRDRNLVNTFNIQWATSQMWLISKSLLCQRLIVSNAADVSYLHHHMNSFGSDKEDEATLANQVYATIVEDESDGESIVIPVESSYEYEEVKATYPDAKPVLVSEMVYSVVSNSSVLEKAKERAVVAELTPKQKFNNWKSKYARHLGNKALRELNEIFESIM